MTDTTNYRIRVAIAGILAAAAIAFVAYSIFDAASPNARVITPIGATAMMLMAYIVGFVTAISVRR